MVSRDARLSHKNFMALVKRALAFAKSKQNHNPDGSFIVRPSEQAVLESLYALRNLVSAGDIPNWYKLYMKGVCLTLGWPEMQDYTAPIGYSVKQGVFVRIYYALNWSDVVSVLGNEAFRPAYINHYLVNDHVFIATRVDHYLTTVGKMPVMGVMYGQNLWFIERELIPPTETAYTEETGSEIEPTIKSI